MTEGGQAVKCVLLGLSSVSLVAFGVAEYSEGKSILMIS